ncbi:MAG TPA: phosphohistidine phosphatase SixA [Bacteroidota bacterium]|nr:phosphohistidine phosphatase SixA [Bacteroidota bacterium]
MTLYIVRHGVAVLRGTAGTVDDERPLTPEGRAKMARAAKGLTKLLSSPTIIFTSPLPRAQQTAMLIAKAFRAEEKVEVIKELSPGGSTKAILGVLSNQRPNAEVVLVGHEPDLGYLASYLLGLDAPVIEFKKGAVCAIKMKAIGKGKGTLVWHLQPRQLRHIS